MTTNLGRKRPHRAGCDGHRHATHTTGRAERARGERRGVDRGGRGRRRDLLSNQTTPGRRRRVVDSPSSACDLSPGRGNPPDRQSRRSLRRSKVQRCSVWVWESSWAGSSSISCSDTSLGSDMPPGVQVGEDKGRIGGDGGVEMLPGLGGLTVECLMTSLFEPTAGVLGSHGHGKQSASGGRICQDNATE